MKRWRHHQIGGVQSLLLHGELPGSYHLPKTTAISQQWVDLISTSKAPKNIMELLLSLSLCNIFRHLGPTMPYLHTVKLKAAERSTDPFGNSHCWRGIYNIYSKTITNHRQLFCLLESWETYIWITDAWNFQPSCGFSLNNTDGPDNPTGSWSSSFKDGRVAMVVYSRNVSHFFPSFWYWEDIEKTLSSKSGLIINMCCILNFGDGSCRFARWRLR